MVVVVVVVVVVVSLWLELSASDDELSFTDDTSPPLLVLSLQAAIDRTIAIASSAAISFFILIPPHC